MIVLVAFLLSRLRSDPPAALDVDAPAEAFSAARALDQLRAIQGDGSPHPVGSSEDARVRAALVAELERLGWKTDVQSRLVHGRNGMIAVVRNVIATLPGRKAGPCVMLSAHYDSVPAGPGASDDGAGVASILEIARALRATSGSSPASGNTPSFENTLVLLLDEGEEAGLLGAIAFVDAHPLARSIGAVVNLEARGTCGRAHMFETSEDNAWLIAHYARAVPHPSAVSVAYELYKRMPNDTDLTVLKRAGMPGLNFAFIGGLTRYHTPLDDVLHLDPRSLQHMGESGLAVARSLADADLEHHASGNAMYCDVLGMFLLRWPESWCVWLAVAALLVLAVSARRARVKGLVVGALAALSALVAATVLAHGTARTLAPRHGIDAPWSAHPWPERLAVLLGALSIGLLAGRLVLRRGSRPGEARASAHLVLALLALVASVFAPSASYLLLLPAIVAAIAALPKLFAREPMQIEEREEPAADVSLLCVVAAAALLAAPLLAGLEDAFGFRIGAALGLPVGIVAMLLAPAFVHRGARAIGLLFLAGCVAYVVAMLVPAHDADSPSALNLARVTDARARTAQWCAMPYDAPMPESVAKAGAFTQQRDAPVPWWPRFSSVFVAPAEPSKSAPPRLDVVREESAGSKRIVVARLTSPRGAQRFAVRVPDAGRLRAVIWDDQRLDVGPIEHGVVPFTGIGPEGVELELEIDGAGPADVDLLDATALTADAARALLSSRPANAAPHGEGDVDVVVDRVRL